MPRSVIAWRISDRVKGNARTVATARVAGWTDAGIYNLRKRVSVYVKHGDLRTEAGVGDEGNPGATGAERWPGVKTHPLRERAVLNPRRGN